MRILLATDGSERAVAAARFLAAFPHRKDAHVHVLTVLDHDEPEEGEQILAAAETALGDFPGHVTKAAARGDSTGNIVEVILWTADYLGADLIVIGASGHSSIARFFLGSIAEAIARHSEQPVLIVRPETEKTKSVVIGLDGSNEAEDAARFLTTTLALPSEHKLHLVQVVSPRRKESERTVVLAKEEANTYLGTRETVLANRGFTVETKEAPVGNPAAELIRVAAERNAGLIVVGSQGLSGVDSFRLGSVAERVLRHAPCSVLVVKQAPESWEL